MANMKVFSFALLLVLVFAINVEGYGLEAGASLCCNTHPKFGKCNPSHDKERCNRRIPRRIIPVGFPSDSTPDRTSRLSNGRCLGRRPTASACRVYLCISAFSPGSSSRAEIRH
ncbi:unnamed protein product [Brassica rapa subsp. trilocularis]